MARVSVQQLLPLIKTKAKDARKVSFVLVVVYEDLLNWLKNLFSAQVSESESGQKESPLVCFVILSTIHFGPGEAKGKSRHHKTDAYFRTWKCLFFSTIWIFTFFFIVYSELEWMLPKNERKKQHNGTAPLRLSSWAHPKFRPYHFHMKPRNALIFKLKFAWSQLIQFQAYDNLWSEWKCPCEIFLGIIVTICIQKQSWVCLEKRHKRGNFLLNVSLFGHQSKGIKLWRGATRYQHWAFQACRNPKRDGHLWASWRVTEMSNNDGEVQQLGAVWRPQCPSFLATRRKKSRKVASPRPRT